MFRNYLAATLRNLARNRLYAAIGIGGLGLGMAAALLIALHVRAELSWDRFVPGYERTYLATTILRPPGRAQDYRPESHHGVAALLRDAYPQIEATARLDVQQVAVRRQGTESWVSLAYADPTLFDVLPLPALAGDPRTALARPDGLVLTRGMARRLFGRDDVLGETLEIVPATANAGQPQLLSVTAVLADRPANGTQFTVEAFASALHADSPIYRRDREPPGGGIGISVRTYLRLAPGADIAALRQAAPGLWAGFARRLAPALAATFTDDMISMDLLRLDEVHVTDGLNPGIGGRLATSGLIAALILLVAAVNFVNLSTARLARRSQEVGVRKASGAGRPALLAQFLGESLLQVALAALVALALTELVAGPVNAFLNIDGGLSGLGRPSVALAVGLAVLVLALLAGLYPALVLSGVRPAAILRGTPVRPGSGLTVRSLLVMLQFAVLIGLLLGTGVFYQQRQHATRDALRVATDQILVLRADWRGPCATAALKDRLQALAGVQGAWCAGMTLLDGGGLGMSKATDGTAVSVDAAWLQFGLFDALDIRPLAGGLPLADRDDGRHVVINETAVRRLGHAGAAASIGQPVTMQNETYEIAAVVPDFLINTAAPRINAAVYLPVLPRFGAELMVLKLAGGNLPETMDAIDALWREERGAEPLRRFFLDRYIQDLHLSILRQADLLAVFSLLAIALAALGLVGLAASLAERRVKEIGIRKAMGAGTGEILVLLLWQFARPVLWANLIAWPVAFYVMNRWLQGFAYRIDLAPWMFLAAGGAALAIALVTVAGHSLLVARTRPVLALRYE